MSKPAKPAIAATTNTPNTSNTPDTPSTTQEPMSTPQPATAPTVDNSLATAPVATPPAVRGEPDGRTLLHLIPVLPHREKMLRKVLIPTEQELLDYAQKLDPAARENFENLVYSFSTEKDGIERSNDRLKMRYIRLLQGTSNDDNRPADAPPGILYTSEGAILTAPSENSAKMYKVGQSVKISLVAAWTGRTFFTPKDKQQNPLPVPGFEEFASKNSPLCRSLDTKRGAPVKDGQGLGDCAKCSYAPWVNGRADYCQDQVNAIVVLSGTDEKGERVPFLGLYEVQFSKTSAAVGKFLMDKADNARDIWRPIFALGSKKVPGDKTKNIPDYFAYEAKLVPGDSGRLAEATPLEAEGLKMLSYLYRGRAFFPALAEIYSPSRPRRELPDGGAAKPAQAANTSKMQAAAKGLEDENA